MTCNVYNVEECNDPFESIMLHANLLKYLKNNHKSGHSINKHIKILSEFRALIKESCYKAINSIKNMRYNA